MTTPKKSQDMQGHDECSAAITINPGLLGRPDINGYGKFMNERDKETIKLVATILGNVAAIAIGVAMFEGKPLATGCAALAGVMSFLTIRSLK